MKKYIFTKIDLLDTYIFADIFDDEKYEVIDESDELDPYIFTTINEFKKINPQFKNWNEWTKEAENKGYEIEITRNFSSIFRVSLILVDPIVEQSILLALKWHQGNKRKTGNDTDMVHLLQVASILRRIDRANPDKILIASALCHDLLEDTDCTEDEIKNIAGKEVLQIVKACSNDSSLREKEDWEEKKKRYVDSVEKGGKKAILVSLADKVANANSLIELHSEIGDKIWDYFNRGKEKKIWFEKLAYDMFEKNLKNNSLLGEYKKLIEKIEKL